MPALALLTINLCSTLAQGPVPGPGADEHTLLLLGLVCLAVAVILLLVEMFVPASGTLALLAAVSMVTGIVLLVWGGGTAGRLAAAGALVASPFAVMAILWLWPQTPLARMITLHSHTGQDDSEPSAPGATPGSAPAPVAIGARGTALTDLRPIGTCVFGSQRVECLAEGHLIDCGTAVVIVAIDGITTKVRAL
jgi:membrane-bound serine protease (ClpP class)